MRSAVAFMFVAALHSAQGQACTIDCPIGKPICGTDGKWYVNFCVMKAASYVSRAARTGPIVKTDSNKCAPEAPQVTEWPCEFDCPWKSPVCGSDGVGFKTYANGCLLDVESAKMAYAGMKHVKQVGKGPCKEESDFVPPPPPQPEEPEVGIMPVPDATVPEPIPEPEVGISLPDPALPEPQPQPEPEVGIMPVPNPAVPEPIPEIEVGILPFPTPKTEPPVKTQLPSTLPPTTTTTTTTTTTAAPVATTADPNSFTKTEVYCEGQMVKMRCSIDGGKTQYKMKMTVLSAVRGRFDTTTCTRGSTSSQLQGTCSRDAMHLAQPKCNGKAYCYWFARTRYMKQGTPCPSDKVMSKYLTVTYQCRL